MTNTERVLTIVTWPRLSQISSPYGLLVAVDVDSSRLSQVLEVPLMAVASDGNERWIGDSHCLFCDAHLPEAQKH